MRQYSEPIEVTQSNSDPPTAFTWRNKTYQITQILDRWRWDGKWWITGTPQTRTYFRVEAYQVNRGVRSSTPRVAVIFRQNDGGWILDSILD